MQNSLAALVGTLAIIIAGAGGFAIGAASLGAAPISSPRPVVEEVVEVTNTTVFDTKTIRREVQSVVVAGETVATRSAGGTEYNDGVGNRSFDRVLVVHLVGFGGDVHATWDAETCDAQNCSFNLTTHDGGAVVRHSMHDPASEWTWILRADETTARPIDAAMKVTWILTWQEPTADE